MASHYFAHSWPTSLRDIWFSEHHTACLLKSTLSTKGLKEECVQWRPFLRYCFLFGGNPDHLTCPVMSSCFPCYRPSKTGLLIIVCQLLVPHWDVIYLIHWFGFSAHTTRCSHWCGYQWMLWWFIYWKSSWPHLATSRICFLSQWTCQTNICVKYPCLSS
jgi:hypothetical protein